MTKQPGSIRSASQMYLSALIDQIKRECGVPPDTSGVPVCIRCRKLIQSDSEGNWFCDCHDERQARPPVPSGTPGDNP